MNQRNVKAVMQFYGANFTHAQMGCQNMEKWLTQLWQALSQLEVPDSAAILAKSVVRRS